MAIVYRHIRLDNNEPFYIGIGKGYKRAFEKQKRNNYWRNVVNKTDYKVDILFDDLTWEEAQLKEIEFINIYGRKDIKTGTLVNLTNGGEGCNGRIFTQEQRRSIGDKNRIHNLGKKLTKEHKDKIAKSTTGRKQTKETIQKCRLLNTGDLNPMYGKSHSEESRKKISENSSIPIIDLETGIFYTLKELSILFNRHVNTVIYNLKNKYKDRYIYLKNN
jgi:hypothetical protein